MKRNRPTTRPAPATEAERTALLALGESVSVDECTPSTAAGRAIRRRIDSALREQFREFMQTATTANRMLLRDVIEGVNGLHFTGDLTLASAFHEAITGRWDVVTIHRHELEAIRKPRRAEAPPVDVPQEFASEVASYIQWLRDTKQTASQA